MQNKKHILFMLEEKILIHSMLINYLYITMETYFILQISFFKKSN